MPESDEERILEWQKTQDPKLFADLVVRYQPVVNSVVNRYRTVGVSPATLRAQANAQMIKAFRTYEPGKGAQPTTHIWNNLQKVQRVASESIISGHIPEHRNLQKATFTIALTNLQDRLGYEPSVSEIADEMGWNQKEVGRMMHESQGEVTASKAPFDFYGNSFTKEHPDRAIADYMYHELDGKDKVIFEHTFGYGGKEILNNKQIAQRLNVNEMAVSRAKKKLSNKIREYR